MFPNVNELVALITLLTPILGEQRVIKEAKGVTIIENKNHDNFHRYLRDIRLNISHKRDYIGEGHRVFPNLISVNHIARELAIRHLDYGPCNKLVLTCVIALTHLVNDLNSLYDEIMSDTQEIKMTSKYLKVINENTWNGMLQLRARKTSRNNTSRPIHQFFLRRNLKTKRSFASQQCECGQNPNKCPRGKQGLQGEKGELGGRLCFISTQGIFSLSANQNYFICILFQ
ncbi:unnamed protein product [Brugia timori]|uniref:Col_cuticle_N domain-containing protein n=1 Tax=Brugia timori TaxID=42155 RepID=A0A0R3Q3L6_9BILA|nr:unnamed protein product [Brugia timori]